MSCIWSDDNDGCLLPPSCDKPLGHSNDTIGLLGVHKGSARGRGPLFAPVNSPEGKGLSRGPGEGNREGTVSFWNAVFQRAPVKGERREEGDGGMHAMLHREKQGTLTELHHPFKQGTSVAGGRK